RNVEGAFGAVTKISALSDVEAAFELALEGLELWLVGDVTDRATDRSGPEEGTLRPAQRLNAVQIEQVEVRREQRKRNDAFIEVDADLLLHARLVTYDLAGGDA